MNPPLQLVHCDVPDPVHESPLAHCATGSQLAHPRFCGPFPFAQGRLSYWPITHVVQSVQARSDVAVGCVLSYSPAVQSVSGSHVPPSSHWPGPHAMQSLDVGPSQNVQSP
jgi:hypothetical protein